MKNFLRSRISALWGIQKEFRIKVFFLTLSFFFLTACQAIWRPLKVSVFISIVGVKSIPDAKLFLMLPLIFLILIYSKLVDWLRRHHLFYCFTIAHGVGGLILYYFLSHPVYGLANTTPSKQRILGWVFYLFIESFGAFMSAVFWSFANSINKPKDATNFYSLFVSGSKIGGILGASTLYCLVTFSSIQDHILLPNCLLLGSLALICAAISISLLIKYVPENYMHGYEAVYKIEKKQKQETTSFFQSLKKSLEGITITLKTPYVFGIFSIIFCYEIIIVIFDYLVALSADAKCTSVGDLTKYYSLYMLSMHTIGLFIALFGTTPIQRLLGIRLSLFACPIISIVFIISALILQTPEALFISLVALRALNYGLNHPTREALFIPTTKAIKFKAKAWTDAFGARFSKASGSLLNKFILHGFIQTSAMLTIGITGIWLIITYFLGKTFQKTIDTNTVIGTQDK